MPRRPEHFAFLIMTVILIYAVIMLPGWAVFVSLIFWGVLAALSASIDDSGGG